MEPVTQSPYPPPVGPFLRGPPRVIGSIFAKDTN